jgi:heterodisulfide reductase subunit A
VAVAEKGFFPGGQAAHLPCKATEACAKCNACLLEETLAETAGCGPVRIMYQTEVVRVEKSGQSYRAFLRTSPTYLDPDACTGCGACFDKCPEQGKAIRKAPAAGTLPGFALDAASCLRARGEECRVCADVCPVGAIDFSAAETEREMDVRAVVAAPGFRPFDPAGKPRYGWDLYSDVISALELDQMLRSEGDLKRPSNGSPPQSVAFIQCVGSRDKSIGRDYCSRVCCGYAMRLARLIRHRRPDTEVSMFYMDLQNTGRDFDRFYRELKEQIEFIHGVPGEIQASEDGRLIVPYADETEGRREQRVFDLVVLSLGLGPPDPAMAEALGFALDEDGFLQADPAAGKFTAGAASGPMSIAESRQRGAATAAKVCEYLKKK